MSRAIRCVVFSRDRPLQLHAFLSSVERHVSDLYRPLVALYRPTGRGFADAYARLREEFPGVEWREQGPSFRTDLRACLGEEPHVVFHTDDDVFFAGAGDVTPREDEVCFSLRLGENTSYCYPLDTVESLRDPVVAGDRISWDWRRQQPGAYAYPLAVNGHVFRGGEAQEWLGTIDYRNPNELEAGLQTLGDAVRPRMAAFRHSRVVSIPANRVNDAFPNRHWGRYDVEELNERFLKGERLDLDSMDFSAVVSCHQEIGFAFCSAPVAAKRPAERA